MNEVDRQGEAHDGAGSVARAHREVRDERQPHGVDHGAAGRSASTGRSPGRRPSATWLSATGDVADGAGARRCFDAASVRAARVIENTKLVTVIIEPAIVDRTRRAPSARTPAALSIDGSPRQGASCRARACPAPRRSPRSPSRPAPPRTARAAGRGGSRGSLASAVRLAPRRRRQACRTAIGDMVAEPDAARGRCCAMCRSGGERSLSRRGFPELDLTEATSGRRIVWRLRARGVGPRWLCTAR